MVMIMVDIATFFNFFINGTINGAYYSLIAIGFSLVYGVGGILNLSHGAYFILTGYLALLFIPVFVGLEWITIILALILITLIGGLSYLLFIKPMEEAPTGVLLITFAFAYFIQETLKVYFRQPARTISSIGLQGIFKLGPYIQISYQNILLILASIAILIVFAIIIKKTKLGNSIRAVSQDKEAATLMGINSKMILMSTVLIAAFLASLAAILYLPTAAIEPTSGFDYLTKALTIVILGGMGSLTGSVLGAYIVGYSITFTQLYIPGGSGWAQFVPLVLIVIILLIRPLGLFGKKEIE